MIYSAAFSFYIEMTNVYHYKSSVPVSSELRMAKWCLGTIKRSEFASGSLEANIAGPQPIIFLDQSYLLSLIIPTNLRFYQNWIRRAASSQPRILLGFRLELSIKFEYW